jgi:hypothetical protein
LAAAFVIDMHVTYCSTTYYVNTYFQLFSFFLCLSPPLPTPGTSQVDPAEQQRQLRSAQGHDHLSFFRPPIRASFQSLHADPEPVGVGKKHLNRIPATITENEQVPAMRITSE